jgi:hypothetical protein
VKTPHLLRVEEGPEHFAELIAAVRRAGMRVGWLELGADAPATPASLDAAAAAGCLRAVAATAGRTVAVKPVAGPYVLRDLLREHFLGCRLVLVRGAAPGAPLLTPAPGGTWTVTLPAGAAVHLPTDALVAALRRPRPWESPPERHPGSV